jgi:hypothetical protein
MPAGSSKTQSERWWRDSVAVLIATILTMVDGIISFYRGVNEYIEDGGSIIPGLDEMETSVGTIIIFLSLNMLAVPFTKMRVSHRALHA